MAYSLTTATREKNLHIRYGLAFAAMLSVLLSTTAANAQTPIPIDLSISAFSRDYVQRAYVAYYGRAADPAGLNYWAARMDSEGQSLAAIIGAFGNSQEFNGRYGGLTSSALVTKIYQQALARDPDPAGLAYYVGELAAGRKTLQSITLDVLGGASTAPDSITVANKLDVAGFYTEYVAEGCPYAGEQEGVNALAGVNANAATVTTARNAIETRCLTAGLVGPDDTGLKTGGISPPPPMSIVPERPMGGKGVAVKVTVPGATNITLTRTGGGCGTLAAASGASPLSINGIAAENGFCDLTATANLPGGVTKVLAGHFEIQASKPDLPPVTPVGGIFVLRRFPTVAAPGVGPTIMSINGPPGFVNGGTATYDVNYTGQQPIRAALVRVPGYEGYFRVPVSANNGIVSFTLNFASDFFSPTTNAASVLRQRSRMQQAVNAGSLDLQVSLEDQVGVFGSSILLSLLGQEVSTGEVKISIAWDTPTDVDLHVIEPSGEEIYYGNLDSATGGKLDLDSNPGCSIDGINNEHVSWPLGQSPSGDFTVRVHMFASGCGEPAGAADAAGTLTMVYCGDDSPKRIPFYLAGEGASQTFTFKSRCKLRVSGTVRFEDFPVTDTGLGASAMVPSRYVHMQVWRHKSSGGDDLLAEGDTDAAGKYDITFENDDPQNPGFYVQVVAQQDSATLKQAVRNLNNDIYAFRSPKANEPLLDSSNPPADKKGFKLDIDVKKVDGGAALNIFDVGVDSSDYARSYLGTTPPMLNFKWTAGTNPFNLNVSFYTKASNSIFVLSKATDKDEYDDTVLGHEYGHFIMQTYSVNNSPNGNHYAKGASVPALAWSEGWATFFGVSSQKRTSYVDSDGTGGLSIFDPIETLDATNVLGNVGGTLSGNISENVVAAVLMDLHDTTNETNDTIQNKSTNIWQILTTYLAGGYAKFVDRGAAGRDLVDFLDGWFCLGYGDKGADDTEGMRGIVKGIHQLSYDFPTLASCKLTPP